MKALFVAAAIFALTLQPKEQQTENGTIEGDVTRHGSADPIANAQILTSREGSPEGALDLDAVTDAEGHFIIRNVAPGKYTLSARRGGYVNPMKDGARLQVGGGSKTITVAPREQIRDANLSLVPGAVLSGRVFDPNGKPLVRYSVEASPTGSGKSPVRTATTNDRGEYRIVDLEAGQYIVAAKLSRIGDSEQRTWVETYYPDATDVARATQIDVKEGAVLTAIDVFVRIAGTPSQRRPQV